jgi:hypothetical protein
LFFDLPWGHGVAWLILSGLGSSKMLKKPDDPGSKQKQVFGSLNLILTKFRVTPSHMFLKLNEKFLAFAQSALKMLDKKKTRCYSPKGATP